jgi:hypothetical protein
MSTMKVTKAKTTWTTDPGATKPMFAFSHPGQGSAVVAEAAAMAAVVAAVGGEAAISVRAEGAATAAVVVAAAVIGPA